MSTVSSERTLVLIKPDGVQRALVGKILERFEQKGLKIVGLKMMTVSDALVDEHYAHVKDRPFFKDLKSFIQSSPLVAIALEGIEAVGAVRLICGPTKAREADAGTIRGDFAMGYTSNIVHTSDSAENAKTEITRFFKDDELFTYGKCDYQFVYVGEENH